MADFQERIGFDATQAITALNRLSASLDVVNQNIREMSALTGRPLPNFNPAAASVDEYRKKGVRANEQIGKTAKDSQRSVGNLTVSWETLSRVIQTQLIIRTMNILRDLFLESADAAVEFQEQVARIAQIADPTAGGMQGLTEDIREMSVELGQPLQDVAEATFEGLQNDLGSTSETMEILKTDAQELALVTGGTLTDSINALSSVIKAYSLSADEADGLSDKFFATIDTGRVTLDEIQSSLGTVNSLAVQAGVSIDEVFASISTITLSGTKASVAMTQLRNVLQKGIKPTDELAGAMAQLGAETFPELVEESGGFREALDRIFTQLENDPERISKAFNTIRGSLGVFNLMANEGSEFDRILDDISNSSGRAEEALEDIDATDFREAQRNAAELSSINEELGETALAAKNAFVNLFLGIVPDADSARAAIFGVAGTMTAFSVSVAAAAGLTRAALLPLFPLVGGLVATFGTLAAINFGDNLIRQMNGVDDATIEALDNMQRYQRTVVNERQQDALEDLTDEFRSQGEAIRNALSGAAEGYAELRAAADEASNSIASSSEDALQRFVSSRRRLIESMESALESIDDRIKDANETIQDIQQEQNDFNFENSIQGLSDAEKATASLSRAQLNLAEIQERIANVGANEEEQKALENKLDTLQSQAKEAVRLAEAGEDEDVLTRTRQFANRIFERRLELQRGIRENLEGINQEEQRQNIVDARGVNSDQIRQLERILQLRSRINEEGEAKPADQLTLDRSDADALQQDFLQGLGDFSSSEAVQAFNQQALSQAISESARAGLLSIQERWQQVARDFRQGIESREYEAVLRLQAVLDRSGLPAPLQDVLAGAETGDPVQSVTRQTEALQEFTKEQQQASDAAERLALEQKQLAKQAEVAIKTFTSGRLSDHVDAFVRSFSTPGADQTDRAQASQFAEPIRDILGQVSDADSGGLSRLADRLDSVTTKVQNLDTISGQRREEILQAISLVNQQLAAREQELAEQALVDEESGRQGIDLLQRLKTEAEEIGEGQGVNRINEQLDETDDKANNAKNEMADIGDQASRSVDPVGNLASTTGGLASVADAAAEAFSRMAEAAQNAADAASGAGSGPVLAAHGGQVNYRAAGGAGRGQDKIPAMLSQDEFVWDAATSRNFFSQLQGLNAGGQVDSGSAGNNVTNVRIGDVHVSSNNQVPANAGRDIAHSLKRELRRSNIRL